MYREVLRREDVSEADSPLGGDTTHTSNGHNMHSEESTHGTPIVTDHTCLEMAQARGLQNVRKPLPQ